eukprot:scaffold27600_cov124-Isochrysis_galbana.AAC.9
MARLATSSTSASAPPAARPACGSRPTSLVFSPRVPQWASRSCRGATAQVGAASGSGLRWTAVARASTRESVSATSHARRSRTDPRPHRPVGS